MVTAPVSPLGQRLYVKTKYATAVATSHDAGGRSRCARTDPANEEQKIHLMYGVSLRHGQIRRPGRRWQSGPEGQKSRRRHAARRQSAEQFHGRALTFNPGGILNGARRITIAGTYAYILCDRGLVVVDLDNPLAAARHRGNRRARSERSAGHRRAVPLRIRRRSPGTKGARRHRSRASSRRAGALVRLDDARNVYVSRTYAYVAGGKHGLAIVNVEQPEHPRLDQMFIGRRQDQRSARRENRRGGCQRLRLPRRRTQRAARPAGAFARGFARILRLQPAAHAQADRHLSHRRRRRWRSPRESIATAPWTKAATSSRSSDAAARGHSTAKKLAASISAMARPSISPTTRRAPRTEGLQLSRLLLPYQSDLTYPYCSY